MQDQLSLSIDRKLQNSLILSMKSHIEERISQASTVILQLLYKHFHRDHHEQQFQRRRASTTSLEVLVPIIKQQPIESNSDHAEKTSVNTNNSTVKVSALVAHYSNSESSLATPPQIVSMMHMYIIR
jgi:hypothetical protein